MKSNFEFSIFRGPNEDQEIILTIEGSSYFAKGKTWGDPYNCYPDDGETEIISVIGPDGKDWEDQLTHSEREYILSQIEENVQNDGPDPDSDYDDFDRD